MVNFVGEKKIAASGEDGQEMKGNLKMRHFYIFVFLAAIAGAATPSALMAGEKEKIDGCLTSLYNYPAGVPTASRPGHRGKPVISLSASLPKDSRQAQNNSENTTPIPK